MEISWRFLVILILILFPGLIIRRLFFYGEFSKQFSAGLSFIKLLSVSVVPGLINLLFVFYLYDNLISDIDLGKVIDSFKDLGNSNFKFQDSEELTIKDQLSKNILPFIGFLLMSSFLIGALSGRLVRITRLDTKFKLLKFKNYWFYLFNNEHTKFKKMRHLDEPNKRHLFTIADILIDTGSRTNLYSGVIVDYELKDGDCQALSTIMLQNAKRYKIENGNTTQVRISGNLLVVDCASMKNLNLTFVSERRIGFLESKWPGIVDLVFAILILTLIPFFIFKTDFIEWKFYLEYFKSPWYEKILTYLFVAQLLSLLNPFVENNAKEFEFTGLKTIGAKLFWLLLIGTGLFLLKL